MTPPARRVLLLTDIFPPKTGGSGRWFREVYSRLPRGSVLVAAGDDPAGAAFDRTHDLPTIRLPLAMRTRDLRSNLKHYLGTAWRLRGLVKAERITAVHAARNLSEGFLAFLVKRLTGVPYLMYAHGEDVGVSRTSRELTWMTNRVLKHCALVVANSANTKRMLTDDWKLPEAKVRVVHPGMDAARFTPASPDPAAREQLGWTDRTVVLTVGRLQERKGHDTLVRALPAIRAKFPNVLYAIVGTGEEEAALRQLAVSEGVADAVQFLGGLGEDAMVTCYRQCDLFALPNRTIGGDVEGFGMVLLEAQACGKTVLAGASGGTAEAMDAPHTGRVADCTAPGPLADAVCELLADPARLRMMGAKGRAFAERFDWPLAAARAAEAFAAVG